MLFQQKNVFNKALSYPVVMYPLSSQFINKFDAADPSTKNTVLNNISIGLLDLYNKRDNKKLKSNTELMYYTFWTKENTEYIIVWFDLEEEFVKTVIAEEAKKLKSKHAKKVKK